MAFCSNCGHEIPEGTKFCPNCGTPAGTSSQTAVNGDHAGRNDGANDQYSYYTPPQAAAHTSLSGIDRFGKYFGIILLILSFVDVISDPAILRIILAVVIIVGAIFCLGKKYKGKVLTVEVDQLDFLNRPSDFARIVDRIDSQLFGLFSPQ